MKNLSQYIIESTEGIRSIKDLEKFLTKFPDDATSWRYATDEIRNICKILREYAEEYDNIKLEAVDFKTIKKPSEWNTKAKEFIRTNINKLSKITLNKFLEDLDEMFYKN